MTVAQDGGEVVSITHRPPLPPGNTPDSHFSLTPQDRSAIGRNLCQWKIPVRPSGIEPATFRFAAQHFNHCATAVPRLKLLEWLNKWWNLWDLWTGRNEVSAQNFEHLGELGIDEMKIDLGDIKVIKFVNGIERPHTSAAGFNEHGDRLPYVLEGRSFFPSWETSNSSRFRHLVSTLFQAPCCPVSQSARQRVRKFSMSQKTLNTARSTWDHQGRHSWLEIDARLWWRRMGSSVFAEFLYKTT